MVNLLESHHNLHGITYRVKIMLKGIAIVKHWIIDYYLNYLVSEVMKKGKSLLICKLINPLTAKLLNLKFHPL